MVPSRFVTVAAVALVLLLPDTLAAQEISSLLARVQQDGQPVAGVEFSVSVEGERRSVGTTGASGLAVVEFNRAPLDAGTRLTAFAVTCGDETEVVLASSAGVLPLLADDCRRAALGAVIWSRTERLEVRLGERPTMTSETAATVVHARSGLRVQVGAVGTLVGGGDGVDNIGNTVGGGVGGEVLVGFDAESGPGIGLAASGSRHGLEGNDEMLWRWAFALEPRYSFNRPDWRARPYVAARVARQVLDADDGAGLATETGWSFGGGGGVVFPFLIGTEFDLGIRFARLSVGAEGFDRSGTLLTATGAIRF